MSGHSKWATIHRKKGELDQARGKVFQKIAKELYVAAKQGSPDPDSNAALRLIVEKAKAANMPKDNIQKAIDKAKGASEGENFEAVRYEGYGPAGVAFMVDCLTDNRNRTASQVRSAFTKHGGNLGTDGSVSYLFKRIGMIEIPVQYDEEEIMLASLDAGAEDVTKEEDVYQITMPAEALLAVKDALSQMGVEEFLTSEVTYLATNQVDVDAEVHEKVEKLMDALEELEDVQEVYHNLK